MELRFRIYPAATPTSGLLATFLKDDYEEGSGLRVELNGSGSGQIVVHSSHADVTAANFARGNYVLVHDLDLAEDIGGFFLTEGEFRAVSSKEGELGGGRTLRFGGPGSLHYLSRAIWWNAPFVASGSGVYNGPRDDGLWHWFQDQYGDILKRFIDEAQDADRPQDPIPDLTYDFDSTNDSASDPWDSFSDSDFTFAIGTGGLETVDTMMRGGLTIWMRPNLLLQAYQEEVGTDRSSATFAAGKVRFEKGENIATDLTRALHETPRVSDLLIQGDSSVPVHHADASDPGMTYDKEGFLKVPGTHDDALLTAAGNADIDLRAAETDLAKLTHIPGDDENAGLYTPGWPGGSGHYWLGDSVTLQTGSSDFDFDDLELRVAAISWRYRTGGDWGIELELGATYYSISQPRIAGVTAPGTQQSCGCCPHGPSGPYSSGDPEVVDYHWGFESTLLDDTATYSWGNHAHAGYTHTHVINPGMGNRSGVHPPIAPGVYHVSCTLNRGIDGFNPGGIRLNVYADDAGLETFVGQSALVTAQTPTSVNFDVTMPAGTDTFSCEVPYNFCEVWDLQISHGGGDVDVFEGDPYPLPATDPIGDHGTPGCEFAYADHRHAAQTAANTPISDVGGYFTGSDVEEALQEIGSGGFGVTEHSDLTGLSDFDHDQYVRATHGGREVLQAHGNTGSTETVDLVNGNVHTATLNADCTFSFAGATNGLACAFNLELTEDGTGGWEPTWPGSVAWLGGTPPTHDTTAGTTSVYGFRSLDGGTSWLGFLAGAGGGASSLDDLTDVVITAPAEGDMLRYDGAEWVDTSGRWEPATDGVDTFVWDGDEIVMAWTET